MIILKPALFSSAQTTLASTHGRTMVRVFPILRFAPVVIPKPFSLISTILQLHELPLASVNSVDKEQSSLGLRLFS